MINECRSLRLKSAAALLLLLTSLASVAVSASDDDTMPDQVIRSVSVTPAQVVSLASQGDADAQFAAGRLYSGGVIVLQDFTTAALWYGLAAKQNHAAAQNALAALNAQGLGVPANADLAKELFHAAAVQGDAHHQFDLAVFLETRSSNDAEQKLAVEWYHRAADAGLSDAQANLGLLYYNGQLVERDLQRAKSLLLAAANKGQAKAQNNLGLMYSRGDGVEQNYTLARQWFEKAAASGLAQAMTNLGVIYENGFGVAVDEEKAHALYRQGGQGGDLSLQSVLSQVGHPFDSRFATPQVNQENLALWQQQAQLGDPAAGYLVAYSMIVHKDKFPGANQKTAVMFYRQSAQRGIASAMLNLGLLYMHGIGVPQDFAYGYFWISAAAAHGHQPALNVRDKLLPLLTSEQINEAMAIASRQ